MDTHRIVAGALFDFAGYLTTHPEVLPIGAAADSAAVAQRLVDFANMRSLLTEGAAVMEWQDHLRKQLPPRTAYWQDAGWGKCIVVDAEDGLILGEVNMTRWSNSAYTRSTGFLGDYTALSKAKAAVERKLPDYTIVTEPLDV